MEEKNIKTDKNIGMEARKIKTVLKKGAVDQTISTLNTVLCRVGKTEKSEEERVILLQKERGYTDIEIGGLMKIAKDKDSKQDIDLVNRVMHTYLTQTINILKNMQIKE